MHLLYGVYRKTTVLQEGARKCSKQMKNIKTSSKWKRLCKSKKKKICKKTNKQIKRKFCKTRNLRNRNKYLCKKYKRKCKPFRKGGKGSQTQQTQTYTDFVCGSVDLSKETKLTSSNYISISGSPKDMCNITSIENFKWGFQDDIIINGADYPNLETINKYAFEGGEGNITFKGKFKSLKEILYNAFYYVKGNITFTKCSFPKLTTFGGWGSTYGDITFKKCSFPEITTISERAFESALGNITFTNNRFPKLTQFNKNSFFGISKEETDITFTKNDFPKLTTISDFAFKNARGNISFVENNFPKLTTISDFAFESVFGNIKFEGNLKSLTDILADAFFYVQGNITFTASSLRVEDPSMGNLFPKFTSNAIDENAFRDVTGNITFIGKVAGTHMTGEYAFVNNIRKGEIVHIVNSKKNVLRKKNVLLEVTEKISDEDMVVA
jgi:hypothetical protein